MIRLFAITKRYDKKKVLNDFSYVFPDTGVYAVKGSSGCGKTTLLNIIGGLIEPTEGEVLYSEDIQCISENLVYIFQDNNLFDNLTVYENIKVLVNMGRFQMKEEELNEVLLRLSIEEYRNTKVLNLSGGERQRVSIAVALLRHAKVIIADEPFSSLDEDNSIKVLKILKELSAEHLIIFSSHNVYLIEQYCENIIDLENDSFTNGACEENTWCSKTENKHILSLKELFYFYHHILKSKKGLRIFSFFISLILLFALAFSFSMYGYSSKSVMARDIINRNADSFLIETKNETVNAGLKQLKSEEYNAELYERIVFTVSCESIEGYEEKEYNEFYTSYSAFGHAIKDDSLQDFEAGVTDYTLYMLRYYGIISFAKVADCLNQTINIHAGYKSYTLKIVEIYATAFSKMVAGDVNANGIGRSFSDSARGEFSDIRINTKTLYYFTEYSESVATKYSDTFKDFSDDSVLVSVSAQEGLTENHIRINRLYLDYLNNLHQKEYQTGDSLIISLRFVASAIGIERNFDFTFIIDEILEHGEPGYDVNNRYPMVLISVNLAERLAYECSRAVNCFESFYVKGFETKDDVEWIVGSALANDLDISYYGCGGIKLVLAKVESVQELSLYLVIFLLIISAFLIIFHVYTDYILNKKAFSILEIYGLRRLNELFILSLDNLFIMAGAFGVGALLTYFINKAYDGYLMSFGNLSQANLISTYRFAYTLYALLIIGALTFTAIFVGFLISLRRKNRSHIENV